MNDNQHDLEYESDPDVLDIPDPPEPDVTDPWEAPDPSPWDPPFILLDEAGHLREVARQLLDTESYLEEVKASLSGRYAGPTYPVELLVLALYSRHLGTPVSVVLRGESSAGKSYAIKQALDFASPGAHYPLTASSPKALIYSDEDLRHRHLVVFEGEGIAGDFASYIVRSLLSEGRIEYEVTDFENKGTVRISKEGPTGLILSTAGRIDYELGTRMISVSIDDSPAVTAEILKIEALAAMETIEDPDLESFQAFDRLLEIERRPVVVPFASRLAELTDPRAVRMRRDFAALLGLVKTHALIHNRHRESGPDGEVLASIADYEVVHGLVSGLLADAAGRSVPEPVRRTTEAVRRTSSQGDVAVTITQVAEELERDRSTASRHLNRAIGMGFVVEASEPRARRRTFRLGDPLPDDVGVLPDPAELAAR